MNTKNFIIGGIIGGVAFFLLGWLVYGNLLTQYFQDHPGTATNVDRAMDQFEWWALILGNLLFGFLFSYIFAKSGVSTLTNGLITGAVVGFLICSASDFIMYATTNISSKRAIVASIVAFTVMSAIVGAVIGAVNGMNRTKTIPVT